MSKPILTKEIAYKAFENFFSNKPFVLFGTGTSCAIDVAFGMPALKEHLLSTIPSRLPSLELHREWNSVQNALQQNVDFELAMNEIKNQELLDAIIIETHAHVSRIDKRVLVELSGRQKSWTATNLFKRLVEKSPPHNPVLHVATPNYDMVAEYAFSNSNILYTTGFWGGVIRKLDWTLSSRSMTYAEKTVSGKRTKIQTRVRNHIRLYKVHGSLNTFVVNDEVIESDVWRESLRDFVKPVIITPGSAKHERLHAYRSSLLKEFDKAVCDHNSFLFLGFGFNDTQLVDNGIMRKMRTQSSPALIITRDSSARIEAISEECQNCWIICKQEDNNDTRIYNSKFKNWLLLENLKLWDFSEFTTEIFGG